MGLLWMYNRAGLLLFQGMQNGRLPFRKIKFKNNKWSKGVVFSAAPFFILKNDKFKN